MTSTHVDQTLPLEHTSLGDYLASRTTSAQRSRVLITSFNHWPFAMAAVAEVALCLQETGSEVLLALWADETPLHDEGREVSRPLSRLLGTSSPDMNLERALRECGLPDTAFVRPPIRRWKPTEVPVITGPMNRSQIRSLMYRGTPVGRAILQVHPDRDTPVTDDHFWPRRWLRRSVRSYAFVLDQVSALIEQREITMVMAFNGRFLHDRAVAEAAARAGSPLLSSDLGGTDADFELTIEPTHDWSSFQRRIVDMYARWDEGERDEIGCGWFEERVAHLDPQNSTFVDEQRQGELPDIPDGRRVVAFFSSSGDEIAELDFDWSQYFGGQGQALKILAEVCRKDPNTTLIVRSHPHKRIKPRRDLDDWLAEVESARPDIHLDPYSSVDSYSLMRRADVVVTYGSTTGIEAAYARKPVVVMGPSAYGELDCVTVVHSREQLEEALNTAQPGVWEHAVAFGLMMRRRGFRAEHLNRLPEGDYALKGVRFSETSSAARHASHILDRAQRAFLRRR